MTDTTGGDVIWAVGTLSSGATLSRQYHTDALASVEAVTRQVGTVEGDYKLDAFGNPLPSGAASATVPENPFVYHGGLGYWSEPELGLTYVRQRWLDTASGQWLSVDPVEGEPRYAYAYNSPTRFVDADGNAPPGVGMLFSTRPFEIAAKTWQGLERWIYTGDPFSSDEVFEAALTEAEDELERQLESINSFNSDILSVAEHGVEKWARDNSKNYARTFSAIGSGIKQYIPFSNTEFSKKILSELDNLVGGKAYTRHRNEREPWQRVFVVPAKGTADEFEYMVGYYWGIVLAVFGYLISSRKFLASLRCSCS